MSPAGPPRCRRSGWSSCPRSGCDGPEDGRRRHRGRRTRGWLCSDGCPRRRRAGDWAANHVPHAGTRVRGGAGRQAVVVWFHAVTTPRTSRRINTHPGHHHGADGARTRSAAGRLPHPSRHGRHPVATEQHDVDAYSHEPTRISHRQHESTAARFTVFQALAAAGSDTSRPTTSWRRWRPGRWPAPTPKSPRAAPARVRAAVRGRLVRRGPRRRQPPAAHRRHHRHHGRGRAASSAMLLAHVQQPSRVITVLVPLASSPAAWAVRGSPWACPRSRQEACPGQCLIGYLGSPGQSGVN